MSGSPPRGSVKSEVRGSRGTFAWLTIWGPRADADLCLVL